MSGTGREVFQGVWDWSVDPFRGMGRVEGYFERSGTGRGTLPRV